MKRQEMIQHLTANCDCYKGKAGAVLNSMSDEQLDDLIVNAQVVAEARKHLPEGASLATNAMPAALMAAMKKKKGAKEEAPDEEDDDEDDAPPTKNSKPLTDEEWLKSAPPNIRRLVRNNLARERAEKDQLIEALVANVQNVEARQVLTSNYLKLDVAVLKAQVDALPTSNSGGEYDVEDAGPTYNAAALSGHDRGLAGNRVSNGEVVIEERADYGGKN